MELTEQLQPVLDFLNMFWQESLIRWILLTVLVNVTTSVAAAIHTGNFKFHKLGEFLYRKILPYGGLYCVYWVIGQAIDMTVLTPVVFGAVEIVLIADLAESFTQLGLKLPEKLRTAVTKD